MDSHEITEHMIDYKMEPWGEHRDDLRAGIIAATINNVNVTKKEHIKKPSDFMPFFEKEESDENEGINLHEQILEAFKTYGSRRGRST